MRQKRRKNGQFGRKISTDKAPNSDVVLPECVETVDMPTNPINVNDVSLLTPDSETNSPELETASTSVTVTSEPEYDHVYMVW